MTHELRAAAERILHLDQQVDDIDNEVDEELLAAEAAGLGVGLARAYLAEHPAPDELACVCHDCGRPYGDEHGFPDLVISNDIWRQISPSKSDGGLLCPSCICKRVHDLGATRVEAAFMSGPLDSIPQWAMSALRWTENLREQGHGWYCPNCNGAREQKSSQDQPQ